MKFLFVIPSITNYFTFLEDLISELTNQGHEVHLATSRKHIARISAYRREVKCVIHDIDFPRAIDPLRHYAAAQSVRKLVARIQPDLINVHFSAALFTTMIAKEAHWPPTTGTIHGLGSPLITGWRRRLIAFAEKWSAERADAIYVLTPDDKAYLQQNAPKACVKVLESYGMGCDLHRFKPNAVTEVRKTELRKKLGINPEDFVYIFIGRQTHFKGYDKVLKAFAEVKKSHPHSKLLLVGEKDRIHPTSLERKFEKELTENEAYIKVGWQENVEEYLAIAHLNVFPSEREGLPVNLMESLAMGVPVVTIHSRGCRDVVQHNVNGFVLEKGNHKLLVAAMQQLQDDPSLLNTFAEKALESRDQFDRSRFIEAQMKIFAQFAGNKFDLKTAPTRRANAEGVSQ